MSTQNSDKRLSKTEYEYHNAMLVFITSLCNLFLHKTSHYKNKWYAACLMLPKDVRITEVMHTYFADLLILATDLTHLRLLLKANIIYGNKHLSAVLSMLIDELDMSCSKHCITYYWHDPMQDYYRLIAQAVQIKRSGFDLCLNGHSMTGHYAIEISEVIHKSVVAFGMSICRHTLDYQPLIAARDNVKAKLKLASFKAMPKIAQVILDALDAINDVLSTNSSGLSSDCHLAKTNMQKNIKKQIRT